MLFFVSDGKVRGVVESAGIEWAMANYGCVDPDTCELLPVSSLEDEQIIEAVDAALSWSDLGIAEMLEEMCRRLDLVIDDYDDCETIWDAITERLTSGPAAPADEQEPPIAVVMYKNYGILGHEGRPVYSLTRTDICDTVTVYIPAEYAPYETEAGNWCVTLSGDRYLLTDVIRTDINDEPYLAWQGNEGGHRVHLVTK